MALDSTIIVIAQHYVEGTPISTVTAAEIEADTLTLYDLARLWGVSYTTVYDQARRNSLPVPTFRVGRRYLVSRKAYEAVMSAPNTSAACNERGDAT